MIDYYSQFKILHMMLAAASVLGFVIRFMWMVQSSALFVHKLSRVLPHVVDTLLLLAGLSLAVMSQQYPWAESWLAMKLSLLVFYIVFGALALKHGQTKTLQWVFFGCAVAVVTQMVGVALHHNPWGWFL